MIHKVCWLQAGSSEQALNYLMMLFFSFSFFFFFIYFIFRNLLINLFLAELGLCCWAWAFSSCGEWGLLFVVVHGLLIAVASLVAEHGL